MSSVSITIVDDSKMSRKAVIRALPPELSDNVHEAANGLEALEKFREGKADVMFLDLTMPEMDGFEVLSELKKQAARNFVFVISADIQPASQQKVMELGAVSFLKKPLDATSLRQVLHEVGLI
ncbi:response regulator [Vibrio hepatarius]|uniref:response regulator n=1 Tax=Vibrio hepatarius TaxID=171383 RepID=UPI00142D3187|nr:response regulator [Vibrio hepatarius]NIY83196.1 response regulator [Vibrio hepatarius]NVJ58530.1 response regulator [Vibrionaceae bacterium]